MEYSGIQLEQVGDTKVLGVTTPSVTQIPVGAPSIGHGPVAVQPPTQDPAAMSPIAQTPFAAPSTTQTPIIVPQAAQIPVSALPKPRKKGPGRLTSNIGALSQSLLLNETASITTLTPSIPLPTAENQPGISTSSPTSSLPLRPAENQPTKEVRRWVATIFVTMAGLLLGRFCNHQPTSQ